VVERPNSGGAGATDTGGNGITILRMRMTSMVPRGAQFVCAEEQIDGQVATEASKPKENHEAVVVERATIRQSSRSYGAK
jgi:hypothetical protein